MPLSRTIRGANGQNITQVFPDDTTLPALLAPGDEVHFIGGARDGEFMKAVKSSTGVALARFAPIPAAKTLGRLFPAITLTPAYGSSHDATVSVSLKDGITEAEMDGVLDLWCQVGSVSAAFTAYSGLTPVQSTTHSTTYTGCVVTKLTGVGSVTIAGSGAGTVNLIVRSGLTVEVASLVLP